jgi:4-hydroxybenzoate polyprenyltransferase
MERRKLQARARAAMAGNSSALGGRSIPATALLHAMRPRQWLKYLLVFVPTLAAHSPTVTALFQSLFAFCAFSICASGTCLLSESLDAWDEHRHPVKRNRSIESGVLHVPLALAAGVVLVMIALGLSAWVEPRLLLVVAIYFVATMLYSAWLKRLLMVDIVALALLSCIPIVGGGAVTHIEPPFWLMAFAFFLFLSLSMLGRHSELVSLQRKGEIALNGSGYTTADKAPMATMGVASGFLAVLVMILYFISPNVVASYGHPAILIGILPLLVFWMGRLWMLSFRGQVEEVPLLYVSRDPASIVVIALCAALVGAAVF